MKKFYISILIISMMMPGFGCAISKLPGFGHSAGNIAGYCPDRQTGAYAKPITTGIDFFITRQYAINLNSIYAGKTPISTPLKSRFNLTPAKSAPLSATSIISSVSHRPISRLTQNLLIISAIPPALVPPL